MEEKSKGLAGVIISQLEQKYGIKISNRQFKKFRIGFIDASVVESLLYINDNLHDFYNHILSHPEIPLIGVQVNRKVPADPGSNTSKRKAMYWFGENKRMKERIDILQQEKEELIKVMESIGMSLYLHPDCVENSEFSDHVIAINELLKKHNEE